jgi:hypothetical protein
MMEDNTIFIGQGITIKASFRDPELLELMDANDVSIIFKAPSGAVINSAVTHPDTGLYRGRIVVNEAGLWKCRVVSVEPGAAAQQFDFKVIKSNI